MIFGRLHETRFQSNGHRLGENADFERDVDAYDTDDLAEAAQRDFDVVRARFQGRDTRTPAFAVPPIVFVPDLVMTVIAAPPAIPCSAPKLLVEMLAVSIVSAGEMYMLWFGSQMFMFVAPSVWVELFVPAWPLTLVARDRAGVSVPALRRPSASFPAPDSSAPGSYGSGCPGQSGEEPLGTDAHAVSLRTRIAGARPTTPAAAPSAGA